MRLGEVTEDELISALSGLYRQGQGFSGIGDDCAVYDLKDRYLLLTTDTISEGVNFPPGAPPRLVGWHLAAVNLSDIAAMGGKALGLVTALGLPDGLEDTYLMDIAEGIRSCTSVHGVTLCGGDTKPNDCLTLTGTAFGTTARECVLYREGARPGDLVAVTGSLGRAAAGHRMLKEKPDEGARLLLEVSPRLAEGLALSGSGGVTSCMDISDGLAYSVHTLSSLNDAGFVLDWGRIPKAVEAEDIAEDENDLKEMALHFGGDYELLVTLDGERAERAVEAVSRAGGRLTVIGEVDQSTQNLLLEDSHSLALEKRGFKHFGGRRREGGHVLGNQGSR